MMIRKRRIQRIRRVNAIPWLRRDLMSDQYSTITTAIPSNKKMNAEILIISLFNSLFIRQTNIAFRKGNFTVFKKSFLFIS
jgi:hypothetical protein